MVCTEKLRSACQTIRSAVDGWVVMRSSCIEDKYVMKRTSGWQRNIHHQAGRRKIGDEGERGSK